MSKSTVVDDNYFLNEAIRNGDLDKASELMKSNSEFGNKYNAAADDEYPLHDAIRNGDFARASELMKNDPDLVNKYDYAHKSNAPLQIAIETGDIKWVNLLIEEGADVQVRKTNRLRNGWSKNSNHETMLEMAIGLINLEMVDRLFEAGEYKTEWGEVITKEDAYYQMLSNATKKESLTEEELETVEKLIKNKGVEVNEINSDGFAPLHLAVKEGGNPKLVKKLIELGAEVNIKSKSVYFTRNGHIMDGPYDSKTMGDRTPLFYAMHHGYPSSVAGLLIDEGADVEVAMYTDVDRNYGDTLMTKSCMSREGDNNLQLFAALGDVFAKEGSGLEWIKNGIRRANEISRTGNNPKSNFLEQLRAIEKYSKNSGNDKNQLHLLCKGFVEKGKLTDEMITQIPNLIVSSKDKDGMLALKGLNKMFSALKVIGLKKTQEIEDNKDLEISSDEAVKTNGDNNKEDRVKDIISAISNRSGNLKSWKSEHIVDPSVTKVVGKIIDKISNITPAVDITDKSIIKLLSDLIEKDKSFIFSPSKIAFKDDIITKNGHNLDNITNLLMKNLDEFIKNNPDKKVKEVSVVSPEITKNIKEEVDPTVSSGIPENIKAEVGSLVSFIKETNEKKKPLLDSSKIIEETKAEVDPLDPFSVKKGEVTFEKPELKNEKGDPNSSVQNAHAESLLSLNSFKDNLSSSSDREGKYRLLRAAYKDDKEDVKDILTAIIISVVNDKNSKININQAVEIIEYAKNNSTKGLKSNLAGKEFSDDISNKDACNFASLMQNKCKECGIYSGRTENLKSGNLVGLRIAFLPDIDSEKLSKAALEGGIEKAIKTVTDKSSEVSSALEQSPGKSSYAERYGSNNNNNSYIGR